MIDTTRIEIITFDCYGTLIDWETGLRAALGELQFRRLPCASVDRLLSEWEAIQFEMLSPPYRKYRDILRASLSETFRRHGVDLPADDANLLGNRIDEWQPFADVTESLRSLQRRYRLGVLSNIDEDILAASLQQMGVTFDLIVTAQQVQSYKPRPAHFEEAIRREGRQAGAFLHAAFGFKYDQRPALALGMQTAWIKRPGWIRDDDASPTLEVESLAELASRLA